MAKNDKYIIMGLGVAIAYALKTKDKGTVIPITATTPPTAPLPTIPTTYGVVLSGDEFGYNNAGYIGMELIEYYETLLVQYEGKYIFNSNFRGEWFVIGGKKIQKTTWVNNNNIITTTPSIDVSIDFLNWIETI